MRQQRGNAGGKINSAPQCALYTPEQRARRDATVWTVVQGILAPLQFLACAVSIILVVRYLITGTGADAATISIIVKTVALYAIMITGSIWEKVVFGKWLFADAFFWEDMVSMVVLLLHAGYLAALLLDWGTERGRMLKLRAARLQSAAPDSLAPPSGALAA
jgi:3-vinyl bacteriochlorophyllide hydratase